MIVEVIDREGSLDDISEDFTARQKIYVRILQKALGRIKKKTENVYLSGKSLRVRTGTLKRSIRTKGPYAIDPHIIEAVIYITDNINPENKVPAWVYGGAWEGWYPLPKRYRDHIKPRPFIQRAVNDEIPALEKELAEAE